MKKILFLLLVTFFVSGVSQAFAYEYDYGVSVGDYVEWDGSHVGSGGEFGFSVVGSANSNWSTFCAETDQELAASGTPMKVTGISNYNTSYELIGSTTGGTGMTDTVAWLYWSFTQGDLFQYSNNGNIEKNQQDLQYLIWSELGLPLPNVSYTYHHASWVSKWMDSATTATDGGWKNDDNDDLVKVQILQLGEYQDVLVVGTANPVPEPTTMALLGIGLIGLVAVGRKKAKQQ